MRCYTEPKQAPPLSLVDNCTVCVQVESRSDEGHQENQEKLPHPDLGPPDQEEPLLPHVHNHLCPPSTSTACWTARAAAAPALTASDCCHFSFTLSGTPSPPSSPPVLLHLYCLLLPLPPVLLHKSFPQVMYTCACAGTLLLTPRKPAKSKNKETISNM